MNGEQLYYKSLPTWECGLKLVLTLHGLQPLGVTPHVGVWIETDPATATRCSPWVTPHVGVWIETSVGSQAGARRFVTPHVGVWIETAHVCQ